MGAAVRIEQGVFVDPRFELLGSLLGWPAEFGQEIAIARMAKLWSYCTDRGQHTVPERIVCIILKSDQAADALIDVDLARRTEGGIYIAGTEGRIEWLDAKRAAGRRGAENRWKNKGGGGTIGGVDGTAIAHPKQADGTAIAHPKQADGTAIAHPKQQEYPPAPAPAPAKATSVATLSSEPGGPDMKPAPKPERKPRPGPEPPPEALELADLLAKRIHVRQPDNRELKRERWPKTRPTWANELRLAHEQDGRPWGDLRAVLEFSQRDPFWQGVILSGGKLREQFDQLTARMKQQPSARGSPSFGGARNADHVDRVAQKALELRRLGR